MADEVAELMFLFGGTFFIFMTLTMIYDMCAYCCTRSWKKHSDKK